MAQDDFDFIDIERRGPLLIGRFDRPDRNNSVSLAEHREFARFLRAAAADDEVDAAVVTGKGRSFSIGGDIGLLRGVAHKPGTEVPSLMDDARELVEAHIDLEKPVVSAMNGWSMGSGAIFGLLCDFVIVEPSTRIADAHVRAGIAAGDGGAMLWPLVVGLTQAKRFLLTGDAVTGPQAVEMGLASELVEDGQAEARAIEIAERLAGGPQLAIRTTKRALNRWLAISWASVGEHALALEGITMGTPEARAAIDTLADGGSAAIGRDPDWDR